MVKPLLKWAGNKARLASRICDAFGGNCQGTYYEPFLGSGAVYLHRRARGRVRRAVLSDVSEKLVATHVAIRDDVRGVLNALDTMPRTDWRERYYEVREAYNEGEPGGAIHAARFIWLNRAGYNGLYRENRRGEFNVPLGRYKELVLPAPDLFRSVSEMLQGVELVHASFDTVMTAAGPGDQVYCDPPYVPLSETASFTGYSSSPFGLAEQRRLADSARHAARAGARVVLSNHDLPVVRTQLYPVENGFRHVARPQVARAISRKASGRGSVAEVIAAIGPLQNVA